MKDAIDLIPKRTLAVRPEKYLKMSAEERSEAKKVTFVPPALGGNDFGHFVLTLKHPIYCLDDGE